MDWLIPYNEGDIIVFESLTNKSKDSIIIYQKKVYHATFNPNASDKIRHVGRIRYQIRGSDKTYDLLEMYKKVKAKPAFPLISFLGTTFWTQDQDLIYQTVDINSTDRVFDEVIVLALTKLEESTHANVPMVLFWDKNEGVIKYITNSGEEWERVNWDR